MKLFVTATIYTTGDKDKPMHLIRSYSQFNVNCLICSHARGTASEERIFGNFNLCLNGKEEDVMAYIEYLEDEGFRLYYSNSGK